MPVESVLFGESIYEMEVPDYGPGQNGAQASLLTSDVKEIPCFSPREDPTNLAARWKRWKWSFNLFLTAKGVTNDKQKVALLLHTGGLELQELHFTLVNEEEEKEFKDCVKMLDKYFIPKVNLPFKRHQFRQTSQKSGEKVDHFVSRLRQKAATCEFGNVEDAIRDQLIEKCSDSKLRWKFLERVNASLKDLQDIAQAYEAVEDAAIEIIGRFTCSKCFESETVCRWSTGKWVS